MMFAARNAVGSQRVTEFGDKKQKYPELDLSKDVVIRMLLFHGYVENLGVSMGGFVDSPPSYHHSPSCQELK